MNVCVCAREQTLVTSALHSIRLTALTHTSHWQTHWLQINLNTCIGIGHYVSSLQHWRNVVHAKFSRYGKVFSAYVCIFYVCCENNVGCKEPLQEHVHCSHKRKEFLHTNSQIKMFAKIISTNETEKKKKRKQELDERYKRALYKKKILKSVSVPNGFWKKKICFGENCGKSGLEIVV